MIVSQVIASRLEASSTGEPHKIRPAVAKQSHAGDAYPPKGIQMKFGSL